MRSQWSRTVETPLNGGTSSSVLTATLQHTEYLDLDRAAERLWEAMRERPDAGVRGWIDVAVNGWPDA